MRNRILIQFTLFAVIFASYINIGYSQAYLAVGTDTNVNSADGTKIKITSAWGDWIQMRRTADSGYWGLHNPQDQSTLDLYYKYSSGTTNFGIMTVFQDGRIVLGNVPALTSSAPYKLLVGGGILTEKLKVAVATSMYWSDYVFDKKYNLRSIESVKKFIDSNQHLPDMPSALEIYETGGVDVLEMLKLQQQKIEELTLYIIQLNDKIKEKK